MDDDDVEQQKKRIMENSSPQVKNNLFQMSDEHKRKNKADKHEAV